MDEHLGSRGERSGEEEVSTADRSAESAGAEGASIELAGVESADMDSQTSAFLEIRHLHKSFGEVKVLQDLSLSLAEGEILALVGLSGSGKTTALRLLAGFEQPDRGEILVDGEDVSSLEPAKRGFGMVFQHYALFPHMTVFDNVAFGLRAQGHRAGIAERVAEMLELVDLGRYGGRRVSEISGGQQQRVALARALAPAPRVLLLDEPLSNLDPALRERTRHELKAAVRKVGITTVLVTHEQEEAFHVGDRVAVLNGGHLEQVGAAETLYRAAESRFVATFIGRASVLRGFVDEISGNEVWVALGQVQDIAVCWSGIAVEPLTEGQRVELVVKPESLRLVVAETGGALPGRIVETRFTGALTYCMVRLMGGEEVEVLVDAETPTGGASAKRSLDSHQDVFIAPREKGLKPRVFPLAEGEA